MTVFVDASALVAMIVLETGFQAIADRLEIYADRICSALSMWETATALCRNHAFSVGDAREEVARYRDNVGLRLVPLGAEEYEVALDAYARFGKGRHRAALNMGDCFAYACARTNRAKLLFKGDDFSRTDIETA